MTSARPVCPIALFAALATLVSTGCQRKDGGQLVIAMGMSFEELEAAGTDLGGWSRDRSELDTGGSRASGEVDGVRFRDPSSGRDIALGPGRVSVTVGPDGLATATITPRAVERCGVAYAPVVAKLLDGGFVTRDGRSFDAHLEEVYARWRQFNAGQRPGVRARAELN